MASHRASGVGRVAGTPALATGAPALRGSRIRYCAGARSAGCPRQLQAARATRTTTLAGPRAFRPRTRLLPRSSQAWGRRLPTASGFASRRKRSMKGNVWLVLGGVARVRSAAVCQRRDAPCSARGLRPARVERVAWARGRGNPGGQIGGIPGASGAQGDARGVCARGATGGQSARGFARGCCVGGRRASRGCGACGGGPGGRQRLRGCGRRRQRCARRFARGCYIGGSAPCCYGAWRRRRSGGPCTS